MKFSKITILPAVALLGVAVISCDDDNKYVPATPVDGVYFTANMQSVVHVDPEETSFTLEVGRSGETAAATYDLVTELPAATAAKFKFPKSVSFAEGQNTATFKVECDIDPYDLYHEYPAKVGFKEGTATNPWGYSSYNFTISVDDDANPGKYWRRIGTAVVIDAWVCPFYKVTFSDGSVATPEDLAWVVDAEENIYIPGRFRLVGPWTNEECVIFYNHLNLNSKLVYVYINAANAECAKIEPQYSGATLDFKDQGGEQSIYIANLSGLDAANGMTDEEIIAAGENDVFDSDAMLVNNPLYALSSTVDPDEFDTHDQQSAIIFVRDEDPVAASPMARSIINGKVNIKRYAQFCGFRK